MWYYQEQICQDCKLPQHKEIRTTTKNIMKTQTIHSNIWHYNRGNDCRIYALVRQQVRLLDGNYKDVHYLIILILLYKGHSRLSDKGSCFGPPFPLCSGSSSSSSLFSMLQMDMGTRAAMVDISPSWLSAVAVMAPLSDVWFTWVESRLVTFPPNIWIRHFLN